MQTEGSKVQWILKEIQIKSLKELSKNPRQIGKDQFQRLGELINKYGLIDKPIVNEDLTIIGGHQRIRHLKKQKVKSVECWVADRQLSEDEIDELCIGLNLHQGSFDHDILANEWDALKLLNYGFSEKMLTGYDEAAAEVLEEMEEKKSKKKKKSCPNCGFES